VRASAFGLTVKTYVPSFHRDVCSAISNGSDTHETETLPEDLAPDA
jgi:hypothetical protein